MLTTRRRPGRPRNTPRPVDSGATLGGLGALPHEAAPAGGLGS